MVGLTMDRDIDFALMLQVLHVRGFSLADIARKTGTSMGNPELREKALADLANNRTSEKKSRASF